MWEPRFPLLPDGNATPRTSPGNGIREIHTETDLVKHLKNRSVKTKLSKAARDKWHPTYKGTSASVRVDFPSEATKVRRSGYDVLQALTGTGVGESDPSQDAT